jgi:hypothetical protein
MTSSEQEQKHKYEQVREMALIEAKARLGYTLEDNVSTPEDQFIINDMVEHRMRLIDIEIHRVEARREE